MEKRKHVIVAVAQCVPSDNNTALFLAMPHYGTLLLAGGRPLQLD